MQIFAMMSFHFMVCIWRHLLDGKNNNLSLCWELNFIILQIQQK